MGTAGLTVTVDYTDESGNATTGQSASSGAVAGEYYYSLTPDAAGCWFVCFKTATATVDQQHLPAVVIVEAALTTARAAKLDYLDMATSGVAAAVWAYAAGAGRTLTSFGTLVADVATAVWAVATSTWTVAGTAGKYILDQLGLITTSRVVTVSPVVGDVITIYRGADHNNADGSAFDLSTTKTLTGGAITVVLKAAGASAADVTYTSSTGTSVPSANVARLELTSTQTTAIAAKGKYRAIWKHTPQGTTRLDVIGDGFAIVEDL